MEQLAFTAFLNRVFGPAVLALLQMVGVHPKHPATPIANSFAMVVLVAIMQHGARTVAPSTMSGTRRLAGSMTAEPNVSAV